MAHLGSEGARAPVVSARVTGSGSRGNARAKGAAAIVTDGRVASSGASMAEPTSPRSTRTLSSQSGAPLGVGAASPEGLRRPGTVFASSLRSANGLAPWGWGRAHGVEVIPRVAAGEQDVRPDSERHERRSGEEQLVARLQGVARRA